MEVLTKIRKGGKIKMRHFLWKGKRSTKLTDEVLKKRREDSFMKRIKNILVALLSVLTVGVGATACDLGGGSSESGVVSENSNQASSKEIISSEENSSVEESSEEESIEESSSEDDSSVEDEEERTPSEGLDYTLSDDGTYYIVTGIGTCTDTAVIIPSTYNELPVTSIGEEAFRSCSSLTKVVIGDSVTSIGSNAFYKCESLTEVVIPSSVTSIGGGTFQRCTSLTEIEIPDSVTSIGAGAFHKTGYYNDENNWEDGVLYIGKYFITAKTDITGKNIIKDGTLCISDFAFENCESLTEVVIPASVTSIGTTAFTYCSNSSLTEIMVDENNANYSSIDGNLYNKDATTLIQYAKGKTDASFTIPNSVTSIDWRAFYNCEGLTKVVIGGGVTSIGIGAFMECGSLTEVVIPASVTSIGYDAFYKCSSLTEVVIPDSVTSIGQETFRGCTSLTSVVIGNSVTSIGMSSFFDCISLTSVVIGNSVTSIGMSSFFDCISLTSVVIGNSVTSIDDYAFYGCDGLTEVVIPDSVMSIGILRSEIVVV